MGKKPLGRPRKKPPKDNEFSRWLRKFMEDNRLAHENIRTAVHVRLETVYGWLAGEMPGNPLLIKSVLMAIYERPVSLETREIKKPPG